LSFHDERESRHRRKPQSDSEPDIITSSPSKKKRQRDGDVGNALRSAYQRMIDEDIPPEMLDLLGKLG
jgi:hypothetical protein